jgi:lipoprotein-releasing system permease protein
VQEKRRDIGILTALGATPRGVLGTFLMIGFWEATLGSLLGLGAGVWAAKEINAIEAALSSAFGFTIFNREVYLFDHIPTVIEPRAVALIVIGAFLATLLAAAFPAWRAARLDPVEALRHE